MVLSPTRKVIEPKCTILNNIVVHCERLMQAIMQSLWKILIGKRKINTETYTDSDIPKSLKYFLYIDFAVGHTGTLLELRNKIGGPVNIHSYLSYGV